MGELHELERSNFLSLCIFILKINLCLSLGLSEDAKRKFLHQSHAIGYRPDALACDSKKWVNWIYNDNTKQMEASFLAFKYVWFVWGD